MKRCFLLALTLIFFSSSLFMGCSVTPKYNTIFKDTSSRVSNEYVDIVLLPSAKIDNWAGNGYKSFQLLINNNSGSDIELDWNKTLYILNDQTYGGFMFGGVRYMTRDSAKPPDVILPGSLFKKTIWPNYLVFYSKGWYHAFFPEGRNGIYLTLRVEGKKINEKLFIEIIKRTIED